MKRLRLRFPRSLKVAESRDIDFHAVFASDPASSSKFEFWDYGVFWGSPKPSFFESLITAGVKTLPIDIAGTHGYDVRGISTTGMHSRWFGVFYTFASYEDADERSARVFDQVIDNACYEALPGDR